ncbi:carbonic anhydrase [Athelia psychrophila]|uniref:Carbonic anhydrase n=1 Tax=Athelia psychrophila TaxID=1759441 RepID=A0A166LAB3_9AGAM|nr:carbonic anhydrase [Fibularhizoctonia sp. CBS 109695]KZP22740.1 carbonic anhydrase [Fibularhizoctonia sp. CBS 109695]
MFLAAISVLSFLPIAIASCAHGIEWMHPFSTDIAHGTFSYETTTGPLNWHNLSANNFLCGNGTNISKPHPARHNVRNRAARIALARCPPCAKRRVREPGDERGGHHGGDLMGWQRCLESQTARSPLLLLFHFHAPSEHRVNLAHYEAEMHFVFTAADGAAKITVLVFLIQIGPGSSYPFLENIFSYLPSIPKAGQATQVSRVDMRGFVAHANQMSYYQYTGSLTTPPCSEGVSWYVATTPIPMYVRTYRNLKNTIGSNNRHTQNALGEMNILQVAAENL